LYPTDCAGFYCCRLSLSSTYRINCRHIATRGNREGRNKEAENEIRKPGELGNISVTGSSLFKSGIRLIGICRTFYSQFIPPGSLAGSTGSPVTVVECIGDLGKFPVTVVECIGDLAKSPVTVVKSTGDLGKSR
jgi:hypothetical protein